MLLKEKKKLTLLVENELVDQAKQFAKQHNISVSQLVSSFFRQLEAKDPSQSPVTDSLAGILLAGEQATMADYHAYLDEKYGA